MAFGAARRGRRRRRQLARLARQPERLARARANWHAELERDRQRVEVARWSSELRRADSAAATGPPVRRFGLVHARQRGVADRRPLMHGPRGARIEATSPPAGSRSSVWNAPPPLRLERRDRRHGGHQPPPLGHVDRYQRCSSTVMHVLEQPRAERATAARARAARDLGPRRLVGAKGARQQRGRSSSPSLTRVVRRRRRTRRRRARCSCSCRRHAVVDLEADDRDREVEPAWPPRSAASHGSGGAQLSPPSETRTTLRRPSPDPRSSGDGEQRVADRGPALALQRVHGAASAPPCRAARPGSSARCPRQPSAREVSLTFEP